MELKGKYSHRQPRRFVEGYTDLCCKCERKASWYDGHFLLKSRDCVGAGFCNIHRIENESKMFVGVYDKSLGIISNNAKRRRIANSILRLDKFKVNIIEQ